MELLHAEVCAHSNHVVQHNNVQNEIASGLGKIPWMQVILEPPTSDGLCWNDISLRGPSLVGRRSCDYDLKIYSTAQLAAHLVQHRPLKNAYMMQTIRERMDRWLDSIEKKATDHRPESDFDFKPLVISTGGVFSMVTSKVLNEWWREIGKAETSRMLETVSISLLISWARLYQHCLLLNRANDK